MNLKLGLAALALLAPALHGCSGENSRNTGTDSATIGQINMAIRLPDGTSLNSVHYEITRTGGYSNPGDVPVVDSSLLRFQVGAIPAATGYALALTATTTAGVPCSSTPVSFDVTARNTVSVLAVLRCGAGGTSPVASNNGNVLVNADVQQNATVVCPTVDGLMALPLETAVGTTVSLTGYATTAPSTSFSWSGAGGTFSAPAAASTTFRCDSAGDKLVTLSVTGAAACTPSTESVTVTCTAVDGGVEPPVDSGTPDTGAPDAGEPDTGAPDTGAPDAGPADAGPADTGVDSGPVLVQGQTAACRACRNTSCRADNNPDGIDVVAGCFEAIQTDFVPTALQTPSFIQDCVNVITCAQTNSCAYTLPSGPAGCYCGSADPTTCVNSGPAADADCRGQWEVATGQIAGSAVNSLVQGRFTAIEYPAGWAYAVLQCDALSCASTCAVVQQ